MTGTCGSTSSTGLTALIVQLAHLVHWHSAHLGFASEIFVVFCRLEHDVLHYEMSPSERALLGKLDGRTHASPRSPFGFIPNQRYVQAGSTPSQLHIFAGRQAAGPPPCPAQSWEIGERHIVVSEL
jgi:hypothetical protein